MVNAVIRWCLNNHFLVILIALVAAGVGYYALVNTPVDAIPDIGEKQVIVLADWPGRSPQDVEDQVTYPLTVSLQGTPRVKSIRSYSGFGFSMIFVIIHDDADYYWARSRVLERMNVATAREASMGLGLIAFWTDGAGVNTTTSQSGQAALIREISSPRLFLPTRSNIFSWNMARFLWVSAAIGASTRTRSSGRSEARTRSAWVPEDTPPSTYRPSPIT